MYYAVSHGPTITPDQTDIVLMENETADIGVTVSYINTLNCQVISGSECIENATVSDIDGWNQTHLSIQATATPGTAVVRLSDPFVGQYADINVTVKAKPETLVRNLDTQTQLSYRYDNQKGKYSYTDVSIRFGALVSKDLWNELDTENHNISGFGVLLTGDWIEDPHTIGEYQSDFVPSSQNYNLDTDIANFYMPKEDMAVPPEEGDNYVWNLFFSVDLMDFDNYFNAAAYIKVGDEYVIMKQVKYSVCSLAYDYIQNRGYDADTADGSLKALAESSQMS